MEIENLNKSQIILLTLLTSFVTSIATGIVTVSLMDQAPPAIAQTVNRVVERTVEKVMPATQTAAVGETKTVVIRESDLIAEALVQMRSSVVRLYSNAKEPVFMGMGLVFTKSGAIIADASAIGDAAEAVLEQAGGQQVRVYVTRIDQGSGVAYLLAATSTVDGKSVQWTAPEYSGAADLGQTIFTISGKTTTRVADGIVSSLESVGEDMKLVDTDIPESSIFSGSPLIDIHGKVVGISTGISQKVSGSAFIPSSSLSLEPKAVPETEAKTQDPKKPL